MDKIKNKLAENKIDAALVSSVPNIIYLTGYSGFSYFEREAFLLISKNKSYLITDGRYSEAVSNIILSSPKYELLEITSQNTIDKIFEKLSARIKKVGIEENDITVAENRRLKKYFKTKPLKDLQTLRVIKDQSEISKIEKACKIGDKAFDFILKKLKAGVTEKQIAFELEMFIKKTGSDPSFPSIVAFGKNSSMPHHITSNSKLITHNPILLDFGVRFDNYCSDMTRTVFFGKADDKFKKIYQTVLNAQEKAINLLNNKCHSERSEESRSFGLLPQDDIKASDVDKVARSHIIDHGFPTIPHSLGHGIGIKVHEGPRLSPKSKDILKPGMVFSIEPGIYLPGYGGVRIEDLVVLEKSKLKLLTHSPKQIIEI